MTTHYRDQAQFPSSSEDEETTSSSPCCSGDGYQDIQGVLSSPFSDYFIQSFLGAGVFGKVVKCVKAATKKTVAVKMIKYSKFKPEAENEVAVLQQLRAFDSDRFNFVRCNDAFIDREHVCLEFEMLDVSLMDFVQQKPCCCLSVKEIRPILYQMATALHLLNSLGIVHSDLKPDNIMMVDRVNQPLKIKMIDFGLAQHVSQTQCGSYLQPRYYRSPEVILGHPYTTAVDMWSLGCIAAELFLGYVLYPGSCEYDMLQHMVQTQGQLPQQLLHNGVKTGWFFQRKKCRGRPWRLKTPLEYGHATRSQSYFTSLDDLQMVWPVCHLSEEDTRAEIIDRENFVDLLKKMLHLDVDKRITPNQLLEDPFVTINSLADVYRNSFYVKTCCEMMGVCQVQSFSFQASTSTANQNQHIFCQSPPAWHSRQEHPLIMGIASSVSSCLSIHEEQRLFSITSEEPQSSTGKVKPVRKRPWSCDRRSESAMPARKRMKMDTNTESLKNSREASPEATCSTARAKRQRKRTRATYIAAHSDSRSPDSASPERKKRRMNPADVQEPKGKYTNGNTLWEQQPVAPAERTFECKINATAEVKPQRKRTRATSPDGSDPERKRRLPPNSEEATTEATSSEAIVKPQRKRTRATSPDSSDPERKRRLPPNSEEATTEATSSEVIIKPQRKRTWATFRASQSGNRSPESSSPERKRKKISRGSSKDEEAAKTCRESSEDVPRKQRRRAEEAAKACRGSSEDEEAAKTRKQQRRAEEAAKTRKQQRRAEEAAKTRKQQRRPGRRRVCM